MLAITTTAKTNNKVIVIFSAALMFLVIVCFIINYSIDRSLNWSLYPTGALVVVWATIAPLLAMKKNKIMTVFLGFAITVISYLFLIQYMVPAKGWVLPLALPIITLALVALALSILAFTYLKTKLYAAAITVLLFGVFANFAVGKIVDGFLNESNSDYIYRMSTMLASALLALVLFVIGYGKMVSQHDN
jgi:hypothetical protein